MSFIFHLFAIIFYIIKINGAAFGPQGRADGECQKGKVYHIWINSGGVLSGTVVMCNSNKQFEWVSAHSYATCLQHTGIHIYEPQSKWTKELWNNRAADFSCGENCPNPGNLFRDEINGAVYYCSQDGLLYHIKSIHTINSYFPNFHFNKYKIS